MDAQLYLKRFQPALETNLPRGETKVILRDIKIHFRETVPQYRHVEAASVERYQQFAAVQGLGQ